MSTWLSRRVMYGHNDVINIVMKNKVSNFNIIDLPLKDASIIETSINQDERGIFSRFFCNKELQNLLNGTEIVNLNYSQSKQKGTLRGLHFQKKPHQEKKFIRCISGSIYDVIVDLRRDSDTYLKWLGVELNENNNEINFIEFKHISLIESF